MLEIGVRRLNLSRGDRSSDDGYSEVTRNRITSMQSFTDDVRNVVEFDESGHPDPHAVVSIGNNVALKLNTFCTYMLWTVITLMVLGGRVDASGLRIGAFNIYSRACTSDQRTGVFNIHSRACSSDQRTGVFNRHSVEVTSDHGSGAFNKSPPRPRCDQVSVASNCSVSTLMEEQNNAKWVCNESDESAVPIRERGRYGVKRGGGTPATRLNVTDDEEIDVVNSANERVHGLEEFKSLHTIQVEESTDFCSVSKGKPMDRK